MQTFLPYPTFKDSARVLDRARLGKQRVETKQILNANFGLSKGWVNHPAAKMWRGHELALAQYGLAICNEWLFRGYKDSLAGDFYTLTFDLEDTGLPPWWGDERVHSSHRSNLLRKNPKWYGQFGWQESDDQEYFWPA
jgi:hypothetical protein